jgi:single-stranded-DNA-specific exonuclease
MQSKRWEIAQPLSEAESARLPARPPLLLQLLHNRQIRDPQALDDFFSGHVGDADPFRLKGMPDAVARLRQAIRGREQIAVYGDFDTDGVTATVLLVEVLSALGAQVEPYIPDRVDEGYGLHLRALRKLYERGVRVVITVDCGIRSVQEVARASRKMAVIVTDHHSPGKELPPATAIINPKQPGCTFPFDGLAGVGLAYKLAQALLRVQRRMGPAIALEEESLLDLVALGTVADLASLLGENRSLVQRGLAVLNEARRPGVEALMADAGLRRGQVNAAAIGFRLGPRLNAAGRIGDSMLAYRLLSSRDPLQTRELAGQLGELNRRRQELTEQTVAAAQAQILAEDPEARLYMAADADFEPGIVGLAASRLTEAYYRPSVVVAAGKEESRGSCRSIPEFHITDALEECDDLLVRFGGHAAAAGFTVLNENLRALRLRLQAIATERLAGVDLRPLLAIDAALPLEEVNWATLELLGEMEPCGVDNPQPILASHDVEVRDQRPIGSDQKHLRLVLRDGRGVAWDAVFFRHGHLAGQVPPRVDVAYTLEMGEWNSSRRLQLNVQDLRPVQGPGAGQPLPTNHPRS